MKDIYSQFSEALAELKKLAPASKFDAVFNECQKMPKRKDGTVNVEAKLNCVEAALKTFKESAAGRNNRRMETLIERAPVRMYNGREHNFNESDPFRRNDLMTTGTTFTEADGSVNEKLEGRVKKLVGWGLSEAEARVFLSCEIREGDHGPEMYNRPAVPKNFTVRQQNDYQFFRACGINESEALAMAKVLPSEIKESRPNRF